MRYRWLILQDGSLPLRPDGRSTAVPHLCTATLVWPADAAPSRSNSIVVDPCFSATSWQRAEARLRTLGIAGEGLGYDFETHGHCDHAFQFPAAPGAAGWAGLGWYAVHQPQPLDDAHPLPAVAVVPCPGHAPDLRALCVDTAEGRTWIVGDAILDRDWLVAWNFYWPNRYGPGEVVQTWRSVARILEAADMVIPGHGPPIRVDAELLNALIAGFGGAWQAQRCPDVAECLRRRLAEGSGTSDFTSSPAGS